MEESINIFYSYAHEDEPLRKKLEKHLALLQHQGLIAPWHDREISAGTEWADEINVHLETAQIILLLISSSFLASEYCYSREMVRALERHQTGTARVIPIILRPVYWQGAPFGTLQALPTDGRSIMGRGWHNRDEAFTDVAYGIHKAVDELRSQNNTALQIPELSKKAEHQDRFQSAHEIVQGVAERQEKQGKGLQQIIEPTTQIRYIVTQNTTPLIPVCEIKPATLNLGDDQSATFPYLPTIFPDVYEQATRVFRSALTDSHQRGLLITGAPMAGKTRLAYQTMYEYAPDWLTLTWTRGHTASEIPAPETLTGQRIILFLDDLQQYADTERNGDDAGTANDFPLNRLYMTLMQSAVQVIIVATCRATDLSRAEITSSLRWLFEKVQVVAIPFLPNNQETAVVELLKATNSTIDYHTEDFDNTVGSLLLGLSRKREQYLKLKDRDHPGYLVLRAMKLLNLTGITQQSKARVRAVAIQALKATMLSNDSKWNRVCEDLDERQFLTDTGPGLIIRKDVYFNKVITDYPTQLRDALLQVRRVFQTEGDSEALIALGWIFSKRQAIQEMLETATMAVELAPNNARAYYLQGRALSSLLRNKEALVSFDQALAIDPTYAAAWNNKGYVLDTLQQYDEALTAYEEAIKLNPQYISAWYNKGIVLGWLKQYEEAQAAFEETIKLNPQNADAWFNKGVILRQLARNEEAQAAFEEALSVTTLNPNLALGWNNKGVMLASLGRSQEALAAYDIAIKLNPQDAGVWFNKGKALYDLNLYEEAIACFDKALAIDPRDAVAWKDKGDALISLERYEEAIACFDKALAINPQYGTAWNYKGYVLDELKRYEKAIGCFDKALTINPQDGTVWSNKGYVLNELKRYEEAIGCFDKALAIDPQYPNPLRHKGNALRGLHRYEEALACLDQALALNPQYGEAWYNKGAVLRLLERAEGVLAAYDRAIKLNPQNALAEDYEEALATYDEVTKLNPQNTEMWYNKGVILGKLGRDEEALTAYDEVIKLDPQNGDAWYNKGVILDKLGRDREVLTTYDEVTKLNPQNTEMWYNKGVILGKLGRDEEALTAYDKANNLKVRSPGNWSTPGFGKYVSPALVSDEYLNAEIVILLQGVNLYGDQVYSYIELTGRNLKRMFAKMQAGENFKPAEYGTIIASGRGDIPQEVRDKMKEEFNMVDVPMPGKPAPSLQPKFLDDEDI